MNKMSLRIVVITAVLLLLVNIAAAQATKVSVCHTTGNGTYQLISISTRALDAHKAHGDVLPGDIIPAGDSYTGQYGSTVTPETLIGDDCSKTDVLRIQKAQNFAQNQPEGVSAGWAGWSCVEPGFPHVVGGGVVPEDGTIIAQGAAKYGAAAIDGHNYPSYPNWCYNSCVNAPGGEEGWVVEAAGPTPPTAIYALCGR